MGALGAWNLARKTKQEAEKTRHALLDAAERAFSAHGVSRTSLSDIATEAGVTRGAVYWHFQNKADLFSAMMDRVTLPLEEAVEKAGHRGQDDPLAAVKGCMLGALTTTATDPKAQRVFEIVCHKCEFVDEMVAVKERYVEMRAGCLKQLESGLRQAVKKGVLPAGLDTRSAAVGLHALVDGLINNWLMDRRYFPLAREAEKLIDLFLGGLRVASPKPSLPSRKTGAKRTARRG